MATLKISEGAWHLRLYRWLKSSKHAEPRDLCSYFWYFVGVSLGLLLVATMILTIIIGTIVLFIVQTEVMLSTTLIILVATGIIVSSYYWQKREEAKRPKDEWGNPIPKPKKKKEPGIVRTYLKSRKEKLCPLIEVVPREGKKS